MIKTVWLDNPPVNAVNAGIIETLWSELESLDDDVRVVVLREGASADLDSLREHLATKFAKWQLPDAWAFIESVPRTSVGKFDKKVIRQDFADGALDVKRL